MNNQIFRFKLGPVQGFVDQARRTRDFWAGSFLLSYLAGHAMDAVLKGKGRLVLPAVCDEQGTVSDDLLAAIGKRRAGLPVKNGPRIGTLPNRFQAIVPQGFDPSTCVQAVREAWAAIAAHVWHEFVEPVAPMGNKTAEIWQRQVENFWDINWVVGPENDLLDRRKNWRSHVYPPEPGDKCAIMGNLQELSGFIRVQERQQQKEFWASMQRRLRGLEFREDERLCAVALIKRLFPLVAEEVAWSVPRNYPSTAYVAAVHWLENVMRDCPPEIGIFAERARRELGAQAGENPEDFACLGSVVRECSGGRAFGSLDADCFYDATLANPNLWNEASDTVRRELRDLLRTLNRKNGTPTPFYALLLMDGDRLGALLQEHDAVTISQGVTRFGQSVPAIIHNCNGLTVYAGGDDVLALLPLDDALRAALMLKAEYGAQFAVSGPFSAEATISGAILYAHYGTPLKTVINEGHRLLDKVAKERTGRDSLAVAVWKTGGPVLEWAAPWTVIEKVEPDLIDHLVAAFKGDTDRAAEFNSTFFYNLRDRFRIFSDETAQRLLLYDGDMVDLLAADYLKNRERQCTPAEAQEQMRKLLCLCRRSWRDVSGRVHEAEGPLDFAGALLIRFLAQKGVNW